MTEEKQSYLFYINNNEKNGDMYLLSNLLY